MIYSLQVVETQVFMCMTTSIYLHNNTFEFIYVCIQILHNTYIQRFCTITTELLFCENENGTLNIINYISSTEHNLVYKKF